MDSGNFDPEGRSLKKKMTIILDDAPEYLRGPGPEAPLPNVLEQMRSLEGKMEGGKEAEGETVLITPYHKSETVIQTAISPPVKMDSMKTLQTAYGSTRPIHLQSADLFDNFSPVQKQRQLWTPERPECFDEAVDFTELIEIDQIEGLVQKNEAELKSHFPHTFDQKIVEIGGAVYESCNPGLNDRPIRVGLVLSGGPAPGGHNVIAGVFDYIRKVKEASQLYGFMEGLDGLFQKKYRIIDAEMMDRFRNTGGFDMLWSGRGRVNGVEDQEKARINCEALGLSGLIIIGGDGSNSNAALLAEHFAMSKSSCSVVGIPKTIDGDLKNAAIEVSFGFDTCTKTYSELIGNLCTDVCGGHPVYHFVRVMGRSASHVVLECALQTRPNLVFIGEEIERNKTTLREIVTEIVETVMERLRQKKQYGIILVPEGLIEFIPEIKKLVDELNAVFKTGVKDDFLTLLTPESRAVWEYLPAVAREPLLADREATGYLQVAKVPTEKLFVALVEAELNNRPEYLEFTSKAPIDFQTHYFGYEGRCAMPSNFDANYCHALGMTGACLIHHKKNGYMAVVRQLEQNPTFWKPSGIPFVKLMEIKEVGGVLASAIIRQLTDIDSDLFKLFTAARSEWKYRDVYRCPGPIQFTEGETQEGNEDSNVNYNVSTPSDVSAFLTGSDTVTTIPGRCLATKWRGAFSQLQKQRLKYQPPTPPICTLRKTVNRATNSFLPKDPYLLRQLLHYYPHLCKKNEFTLQEFRAQSVEDTPAYSERRSTSALRVAICFVSRQSPGMVNIAWGLHERMKLIGGACIGLFGAGGLYEGKHIVTKDEDFNLHKNLGGIDLLGNAPEHGLLVPENRDKVLRTCQQLSLNGLVLVGSSLALTEAALLTEHFLSKSCKTCVIGVPATCSNNVLNRLIETNVGFDTASKVYASLIGNVLTDAASMPKYWHLVRLMGRQPSNVVLECALQTHPNFVVVAEEYGSAQKGLADVVSDIADVICQRAEAKKNFGSVLIPDGLLMHLPGMKELLNSLDKVIKEAMAEGRLKECQKNVEPENNRWIAKMNSWSLALFCSLPVPIRKELLKTEMGELKVNTVETEHLLGIMIKQELATRKANGTYSGNFQYVTHFFGYQGMSAVPSLFDANLAYSYGHLAGIAIENKLTGHCCTIRGLCGKVNEWVLAAVPFNCLMALVPSQQEIQVHPLLVKSRRSQSSGDMPIIPNAEVSLDCKAYQWMKLALQQQWSIQDRFCNPGPIQFLGPAANFYHRILHEEQIEYWDMLRCVEGYAARLQSFTRFGVEPELLKTCYITLTGLLAIAYHPEDLMKALPPAGGTSTSLQLSFDIEPSVSYRSSSGMLQRAVTTAGLGRMNSLIQNPRGIPLTPPTARSPTENLDRSSRPMRTQNVDSGWGVGRGVEDLPSEVRVKNEGGFTSTSLHGNYTPPIHEFKSLDGSPAKDGDK